MAFPLTLNLFTAGLEFVGSPWESMKGSRGAELLELLASCI